MRDQLCCAGLAIGLILQTGCHSRHIEIAVENRTGKPIQQLEVDYPSATFGRNSLNSGADFHYRVQVRGNGNIKVQYANGDGLPFVGNGPALAEDQEGRLEIVLLPGGEIQFHPQLSSRY